MLKTLPLSLPGRRSVRVNPLSPAAGFAFVLAYIGAGFALVGEAVMRIGHLAVRVSYRLLGDEDRG